MGKQKESFEVWNKPRTRGKPGTRAHPNENVQDTSSRRGTKDKVTKSTTSTVKPRGMKRTSVSPIDCNSDSSGEGQQQREKRKHSRKAKQLEDQVDPTHEVASKSTLQRNSVFQNVAEGKNSEGDLPVQTNVNVAVPMALPELESGGEKCTSPNREKKRQEKKMAANVPLPVFRMKGNSKPSRQKRQYEEPTVDIGYSSEPSYSTEESDRRRRSVSTDSVSSGLVHRNVERKRGRSHGRRRRSHTLFEDEWHRRRMYSKQRKEKSRSGDHDWHDGRDQGECSKQRRRRPWRRSVSSTDDGRMDNEKKGGRENSSEEEFERKAGRRDVTITSGKSSSNDETAKRRDRRHRQKEREANRRQRESQGLKGHYIAVDEHEEPYSYGIGAWRLQLSKLCASLDPSVMDIRWQPEEAMKLLRKRLKEDFEYSAPVSRAFIQSLAGRSVTQRRNKIINSMRDNAPCPAGMDVKIWRRLDRIRLNPRRKELSQRMKYANSCRTNVGRIGPKGLSGVRNDLRKKLGREPDPDEVQEEMRRDKGYSGRSKKKKTQSENLSSQSEDEEKMLEHEVGQSSDSEAPEELVRGKKKMNAGEGAEGAAEAEYIKELEKKIEELTAKKKRGETILETTGLDSGGPSNGGCGHNLQKEGGAGITRQSTATRSHEEDSSRGIPQGNSKPHSRSPVRKSTRVYRN